jgi:hypothetical protein
MLEHSYLPAKSHPLYLDYIFFATFHLELQQL